MTDQDLRRELAIMGYRPGTPDGDGALAAARVHARRIRTALQPQAVTLGLEAAQRLFDLATDSPLMCSGSFETEDVIVLRELAGVIGVDLARATPDEFTRDFPHPFQPFTARQMGVCRDEVRDDTAPGGRRWETDAEVYERLGERPDQCVAGAYDRKCRRPEADAIHSGGATA